jgi:hypothetical protein
VRPVANISEKGQDHPAVVELTDAKDVSSNPSVSLQRNRVLRGASRAVDPAFIGRGFSSLPYLTSLPAGDRLFKP